MPRSTRLAPALVDLAGTQHGVISTAQLLGGCSAEGIASLVRIGALEHVRRGLYRLPGASPTYRQRAMAEVLVVGAPVSTAHATAARLWGFEEVGTGLIEMIVPVHRRSRSDTAAIVRRRSLPAGDVTERYGIPSTSPVRTLLDLVNGAWSGVLLERCIDDFLRRGVVTPDRLADGIIDARRHRGREPLLRLVEPRLEGLGQTHHRHDSRMEQELWRCLLDAGIPPAVPQHPVVVGDRVYRLDLAVPEYKVAIEYDGYEHHSGRRRFDDDRRRWGDLQAAGWVVIIVTSRHSRDETVTRVRAALTGRGWSPPA